MNMLITFKDDSARNVPDACTAGLKLALQLEHVALELSVS